MIWYLYVLQNGYCNKFSYCPHHSSYNFFLVIRNFKIYSLLLFSCSVILNSVTSWTAALPGFAILHYLLDFAQTHVHWISDTMQPSNPLSPSFLNAYFRKIKLLFILRCPYGANSIKQLINWGKIRQISCLGSIVIILIILLPILSSFSKWLYTKGDHKIYVFASERRYY